MKLTAEDLEFYNSNRSESISKMGCWSPVKNLFIGMRGRIMTCCYNKSYLLGEYPKQSIKDAWFGEKRKELEKSLLEYDFSKGCQSCYEVITAKNIGGLTAKKFDYLPLNETYPTRIDFELSNECNLECKMCRGEFSSSIRKNVEKLPPIPSPYNSDLLLELKEFIPYLHRCHFLGGEPFLIPIYLDIWDLISELNPSIRISVTTNATVLSDRVKKILDKINCDITVSIDSIDERNYAQIRKNANLQKVKNNINYLREYTRRKNTSFGLSACAMTLNAEELVDITEFANQLDCEIFFTRVSYPRELSLEIQSVDYLDEIIESIRTASLSENNQTQQKNKKTLNDLANNLEFWKNERNVSPNSKNIVEYLEGLKDFLQQKSPDNFEAIFENIKEKTLYLLEIASKNNLTSLAEEKLCEVPFKTMYEMVPSIEKEHLLHLFKSFVMPIDK